MSRELDEKVARVLEWPHVDVDDAQWKNWHLPGYSTEHACVGEMLAWLRTLGHHVVVLAAADGLVTVHCFRGPLDYSVPMQNGATLPEALARLVVAVAEAKEAGK